MRIIRKPGAKRPRKGTPWSAGYDLASTESCIIPPGCYRKIPLGIHFEIPKGQVGTLSHRSGMNSKQGVQAFGQIDSDYRGEACVTLFNADPNKEVRIKDGDYVCQIIFHLINHHTFEEVDTLSETTRGEGGHGSTGR